MAAEGGRRVALRVTSLTLLGMLPCVTALAESLPASVRACVSERDAARRLACFDEAVASVMKKEPAPESQLGAEQLRDRHDAQGQSAKPRHLKAILTAVSRDPQSRLILSLDNGQVWQQSEAGPDLRLQPGDAVTVERGVLGSYWLSGSSRVAIKVRRAR